jgi:hypothetical protein
MPYQQPPDDILVMQQEFQQGEDENMWGNNMNRNDMNGPMTQLDDDSSSSGMHSGAEHNPDDPKYMDPKYCERRRRNNLAAKKCRENRKVINEMRLTKSKLLETENSRLKKELRSLADEVSSLKELVEKKKMAIAKGEKFDLPKFPNGSLENVAKDEFS